jgi:hypothetical protein
VYIWLQVQMSNYRIKYGIITNNSTCQFRLHHCDGLVEMIKLDILFIYFGAHMKKILEVENYM